MIRNSSNILKIWDIYEFLFILLLNLFYFVYQVKSDGYYCSTGEREAEKGNMAEILFRFFKQAVSLAQ